jgi:hypothetical protein
VDFRWRSCLPARPSCSEIEAQKIHVEVTTMAERYTRRQNTDWWEVQLNKIIDEGEELRAKKDFRQFDDLLDHRGRIQDWLERAASYIGRIYQNRGLGAEYCRALSEIDLNEVSWVDAIKFFRDSISERIEALKKLISKTDK